MEAMVKTPMMNLKPGPESILCGENSTLSVKSFSMYMQVYCTTETTSNYAIYLSLAKILYHCLNVTSVTVLEEGSNKKCF
jgi:hypothetical protein